MSIDFMKAAADDAEEQGYEEGWQDGFDACQKRYINILKRFPLHCAAISLRLPLHPSQPDEILEREAHQAGHILKG